MARIEAADEFEIIYRASFWHKWAKKRIFARDFGLEAFAFKVPKKTEGGKRKSPPKHSKPKTRRIRS